MSKSFKAIAAMSENRVIGSGNIIPWHLPEDFKFFKATTVGHVVVMGRKTFESLGKPLPSRTNLVLTRNPERLKKQFPSYFQSSSQLPGTFGTPKTRKAATSRSDTAQLHLVKIGAHDVRLVSSISLIVPANYSCQVFICGGAEIYRQTLPLCSDLYLTHVKRVVEGDAFFPPFEHLFEPVATLQDNADFRIVHYRRRLA